MWKNFYCSSETVSYSEVRFSSEKKTSVCVVPDCPSSVQQRLAHVEVKLPWKMLEIASVVFAKVISSSRQFQRSQLAKNVLLVFYCSSQILRFFMALCALRKWLTLLNHVREFSVCCFTTPAEPNTPNIWTQKQQIVKMLFFSLWASQNFHAMGENRTRPEYE